jgi:diguanylate cyclase (GGDEF)-like protein
MPGILLPRKRPLLLLLAFVLCLGFLGTTTVSYQVSKQAIRNSIQTQELPLTSDNVYSEILKDLVRPVFVSSMMANDTFLRDWTLRGEAEQSAITRYLREVMAKYGAFTSFFVSEKSRKYYHPTGVLKQVSELSPLDAWYFRVRQMNRPYEINVDPDMANRNLLTIFINYRVQDFEGRFIGAAGVGLTVESVRQAIDHYQQRFGRKIYFVDPGGHLVLYGEKARQTVGNINSIEGLRDLAPGLLSAHSGSYEYRSGGETHLLNVRFIPELNWFLFVEKTEDTALEGIRHTLYVNLAVCLLATILVVSVTGVALGRYQQRMEEMATTDKLTGLLNRQTLDGLFQQAMGHAHRNSEPLCVVVADIDRFKQVNDEHGHLVGDAVLRRVAACLSGGVRASDTVCRWGGEEFLLILGACDRMDALALAEKLRAQVAGDGDLARMVPGGITMSFGVAALCPGDTVDKLVGRADAALYQAKQDGRDCVREGDACRSTDA